MHLQTYCQILLMLGGIGVRRRRGRQRMRWPDGISLSKLWELVDREAWRAAIHGVTKSQARLNDWTELNWTKPTILVLAQELCSPPSGDFYMVEKRNLNSSHERGSSVYSKAPLGPIFLVYFIFWTIFALILFTFSYNTVFIPWSKKSNMSYILTCTNSFNPHTDFEASILIMNNFIKIYPKNQ